MSDFDVARRRYERLTGEHIEPRKFKEMYPTISTLVAVGLLKSSKSQNNVGEQKVMTGSEFVVLEGNRKKDYNVQATKTETVTMRGGGQAGLSDEGKRVTVLQASPGFAKKAQQAYQEDPEGFTEKPVVITTERYYRERQPGYMESVTGPSMKSILMGLYPAKEEAYQAPIEQYGPLRTPEKPSITGSFISGQGTFVKTNTGPVVSMKFSRLMEERGVTAEGSLSTTEAVSASTAIPEFNLYDTNVMTANYGLKKKAESSRKMWAYNLKTAGGEVAVEGSKMFALMNIGKVGVEGVKFLGAKYLSKETLFNPALASFGAGVQAIGGAALTGIIGRQFIEYTGPTVLGNVDRVLNTNFGKAAYGGKEAYTFLNVLPTWAFDKPSLETQKTRYKYAKYGGIPVGPMGSSPELAGFTGSIAGGVAGWEFGKWQTKGTISMKTKIELLPKRLEYEGYSPKIVSTAKEAGRIAWENRFTKLDVKEPNARRVTTMTGEEATIVNEWLGTVKKEGVVGGSSMFGEGKDLDLWLKKSKIIARGEELSTKLLMGEGTDITKVSYTKGGVKTTRYYNSRPESLRGFFTEKSPLSEAEFMGKKIKADVITRKFDVKAGQSYLEVKELGVKGYNYQVYSGQGKILEIHSLSDWGKMAPTVNFGFVKTPSGFKTISSGQQGLRKFWRGYSVESRPYQPGKAGSGSMFNLRDIEQMELIFQDTAAFGKKVKPFSSIEKGMVGFGSLGGEKFINPNFMLTGKDLFFEKSFNVKFTKVLVNAKVKPSLPALKINTPTSYFLKQTVKFSNAPVFRYSKPKKDYNVKSNYVKPGGYSITGRSAYGGYKPASLKYASGYKPGKYAVKGYGYDGRSYDIASYGYTSGGYPSSYKYGGGYEPVNPPYEPPVPVPGWWPKFGGDTGKNFLGLAGLKLNRKYFYTSTLTGFELGTKYRRQKLYSGVGIRGITPKQRVFRAKLDKLLRLKI